MKLTKFISATLALVLGFATLSSCSDNDNDAPEAGAADAVAGAYTGKQVQTVTMNGVEMDAGTYENYTYTLTATSTDEVSIKIPQHSMTGVATMVIPEITVTGVKVTGSNGVYTLARTENTQEVGGMNFKTVLQGTIKNGALELETAMTPGAMPFPIIGTFTGSK